MSVHFKKRMDKDDSLKSQELRIQVRQRLLKSCLKSINFHDHLKMGLIRSGNTESTPMSDNDALTKYLWPIVCEMIKTVIENKQSLII